MRDLARCRARASRGLDAITRVAGEYRYEEAVRSGGGHGGWPSLYASEAFAQHKAPNPQPPQAAERPLRLETLALGSVRLPKGVSADGKPLPAGTYQVRLTHRKPGPAAVGITETLERWVEFVQGGSVKAARSSASSRRPR